MNNKHTLVKGIHKTKTTKSKNFKLAVEIDVPELDGFLDAKEYGAVVVQDMVNDIADKWSRGKHPSGYPATLSSKAQRLRKLNHSAYYREVTPDEEDQFARALAYQTKNAHINKYRRKVKSNYRYRPSTAKRIKPTKDYSRTPRFNEETPFYISGIMINSLYGRFVRARSFRLKSGKMVHTKASVVMGVKRSRVYTAFAKAGFDNYYKNRMIAGINSGYITNSNYSNTRLMRQNLMSWRARNRAYTAGFIAVRLMLKALSYASRSVL